MSLFLGMKQVFLRNVSIPISSMYSMNFLLITSKATGTGILVNRALASKDPNVSSAATLCSLRVFVQPLLSLTNKKLLPQYC